MRTRRPVSRVLCRLPKERALGQTRRPFLWTAHCWAVLATHPGPRSAGDGAARLCRRTERPLFGLAPGGACHAVPVTRSAVGSYPTLSPLPSAEASGGLLSVALSLGSPPAGVTRRLVVVEPGLSSPASEDASATARPSGPGFRLGPQ